MTHVSSAGCLVFVVAHVEVAVAVEGFRARVISGWPSGAGDDIATVEEVWQRDSGVVDEEVLNGMQNAAECQTVFEIVPFVLAVAVSEATAYQEVGMSHLVDETCQEWKTCRLADEVAIQRDDDLAAEAAER